MPFHRGLPDTFFDIFRVVGSPGKYCGSMTGFDPSWGDNISEKSVKGGTS